MGGRIADVICRKASVSEVDLTIAYRVYPHVSKTPAIYPEDKYKLAEFCVRSLKKSLGDLRVKIIVLLDNCPAEYRAMFRKHFSDDSLVFIELPGIGNRGTFLRQIDELLRQEFSELVYFAEDDYYYLEGQFHEMVSFIQSRSDVHFVTPYDHPAYYREVYHQPSAGIEVAGARYWKRARSTCLTFLTTKKELKKCEKIMKSYNDGNHDYGIWMAVTKFDGLNAIALLQVLLQDCGFLKKFITTIYFGWRHLLFAKKMLLWSPIPTIATHLEKECLAPGIGWHKYFATAKGA